MDILVGILLVLLGLVNNFFRIFFKQVSVVGLGV